MKNKIALLIVFYVFVAFVACNSNKQPVGSSPKVGKYISIGSKIDATNVLSKQDMNTKYASLNQGDTLQIKFKSTITDVCQNKGCWMKLDLSDSKETFVKFKDYGFFMPLDSKNSEVIVHGKAFVSIESVEDQKHYAEDAGKTKEEIAKIITPKSIYSFLADGVLIKK